MSVLTLRPNGDSAPLEWYYMTSIVHYENIDESTLDTADYNYLFPDNTAYTDIYSFPNHSSESGNINSVTVKAVARYFLTGTCATEATISLAVKIGSTVYYGNAQNLTTSNVTYSKAWTTNPETSSAWSWTEIDDLLAGGKMYGPQVSKNNSRNPSCYQLWVEVDYTAGGSTVFLPNIMKHNFIPPLIGGY